MKFLIHLAFLVISAHLMAEDEGWTSSDQWKNGVWPAFEHPRSFVFDEVNSRKGDDNLHTLIYLNAKSGASFRIVRRGYVAEHEAMKMGYSTPRDYVLVHNLTNAERIVTRDFEAFLEEGDSNFKVVLLHKNASWGYCYDVLSMSYPSGATEQHKAIVKRIIKSYNYKAN